MAAMALPSSGQAVHQPRSADLGAAAAAAAAAAAKLPRGRRLCQFGISVTVTAKLLYTSSPARCSWRVQSH